MLCTLLPLLLVNFLTMYQYNFDAEIIEVVCLTFMQQYAFMSMVSSFISTGVNSYILSTKINDIAKKLCVDKNSNSYESFIK
ncbi:hypothetical protein FACS189459_1590 [Bacilli bacterium]|nr:hypothetical protein FACS189459_1590 [Bacilli bacterium]